MECIIRKNRVSDAPPRMDAPRQLFVNLPVRDLKRSMRFYAELGFAFQPQYTDDKSACVVVGERAYVMLLDQAFFGTFLPGRTVCDARKSTEVLVCISCRSQLEVDQLVERALAAGGKAVREAQDLRFMYQHGFEDPDGHIWELVYLRSTPSAAP